MRLRCFDILLCLPWMMLCSNGFAQTTSVTCREMRDLENLWHQKPELFVEGMEVLSSLFVECNRHTITHEEFAKEARSRLNLSDNDPLPEVAQCLIDICRTSQTHQNNVNRLLQLEAAFKNNKITEEELREQYEETARTMLSNGELTQEKYTELIHEIPIDKWKGIRKYKAEQEKLNRRHLMTSEPPTGRLPIQRWQKESYQLVDELEADNTLSHEEAEEYREQIDREFEEFHRESVARIFDEPWGRVAIMYDVSPIMGYPVPHYDVSASDLYHRPDEFRIKIGIQGGVIWDNLTIHQGAKSLESFWEARAKEEKLGNVGLTLDLSYQWHFRPWYDGVPMGLALFARQEIGWGFWTGKTANAYDPQFIGSTVFGLRTAFYFADHTVMLTPCDIGFGFAYSGGDNRKDSQKSHYKPAYLFDDELNKTTAFAIYVGAGVEYFISDHVAIGGGLNFTAILPSSVKIYDRTEENQISLDHRLYMFSPDIHVSFAFGHVSIDSDDE